MRRARRRIPGGFPPCLFALWALLLMYSGGTAAAGQFPAAVATRVDAFVAAEMARQKLPGVAVGVFKGGEAMLLRGYGFANLEHRVPVTPATVFQTASVGKQFTAVAVMLLVEDGKLDLDASIRTYFPDAPPSWQAVTPRQLLTHTSGIPDYFDALGSGGGADFDERHDYTEDELRKAFYSMPLEFAPGSRWHYSNSGYALLGFLVRRVSGRFYGEVLAERVFAPLGMRTARVISEADIVADRAAGYRLVDGAVKNQEWYAPAVNTTADGALYLSLRDYLAWERGLRSGALLSRASWQQVYAAVELNSGARYPYGFGWVIDRSGNAPWYHHSGSSQGFKIFISRYLGEDLTLVVLTNLADADPARFVDGVAAIVAPQTARLRPGIAIADTEPETAARVRALLVAVAAGPLPARELLYPGHDMIDRLGDYGALLRSAGTPQRLELLDRRTLGDDRASIYRVVCEHGSLRATVEFAPDGRIAELEIEAD